MMKVKAVLATLVVITICMAMSACGSDPASSSGATVTIKGKAE